MKRLVIAVAAMLAVATPSSATVCPVLMTQFEKALKTTSANDATKAKAKTLYNRGKADHAAGKHSDSERNLKAALKLLGK